MCPKACPKAGAKCKMICTKPNVAHDHANAASIYKSNYISCSKDHVNKAITKQIFTTNATVLSGKANQTTFHAVMVQS